MPKIDKNDQLLIELLRENSKRSMHELAQRIGLPATTVHNRIRRLEQHGIIQGYTVLVDENKLGRQLSAYVLITTSSRTPTGTRVNQEDLAREIRNLGAENAAITTGGADIVARVHAKDIAALNEFVVRKLRALDGVDKTQTMIVLSTF